MGQLSKDKAIPRKRYGEKAWHGDCYNPKQMKAYSIRVLFDDKGKVLNADIPYLFKTREEAESYAKRGYPDYGYRIREWTFYPPQ